MLSVHRSSLYVFWLTLSVCSVYAADPASRPSAPVEAVDPVTQSDASASESSAQEKEPAAEADDSDPQLADFARAMKLDPADPQPYRLRADYWSRRRETNSALRDLDEALIRDPRHAATYAQRGLHRALKHHWDESLADMETAIELDATNPEFYFDQALILGAMNERRAAVDALESAIQINPDYAMAYAFRGWQWLIAGNCSQAVEDYSEALKLDSRNCGAYMYRAIARMRNGDFSKAISDLTIADEIDARVISAGDIAFVAQELLRSTNSKLTERDAANSDDRRDAAAYRDRGIANRALGRWNDALKDLNEAIRLNQSSSLAFVTRGRLWLYQSDWDRAIEDLDSALELNPNDPSVWFDRGKAWAEKKNWAEACESFTHCLQIDARNSRALAERGAAWQAQSQWELAVADYEQVMHGIPFYVHPPRTRWQDEASETPSEGSDSTAELASSAEPMSDDERPILASKVGLRLNESAEGAFISENSGVEHERRTGPGNPNSSPPARPAQNNSALHAVCLDPIYLKTFINHAQCMVQRANWEEALKDYLEIARLAPNDPLAFRHIAWIKATCPDQSWRNGDEAVQFGRKAVERGHAVEDLVALSAAYAEAKYFLNAQETLSKARDMIAEQSEKELQAHRQHYKAAEFEQLVDDEPKRDAGEKTREIEVAINACNQSEWKDAQYIEVLAETYAAAGQFEKAISCCEKYLELRTEERDKPLRDLIEAFEARQPLRTNENRLIAGSSIVKPKVELFADNEIVCMGGLPANQLTVAQTRLLSFNPREAPHTDSAAPPESDEKPQPGLVSRGMKQQQQGEFELALKDFQEAIQLDSRDAHAFNSMARLRATCSVDRFRDGKEALKFALTACELTDWKDWKCLDTLATAYAETGDFKSAIQWTDSAIELIPFDESDSETERLKRNLDLYRQNKPIRE